MEDGLSCGGTNESQTHADPNQAASDKHIYSLLPTSNEARAILGTA